LHPWVFGLEKAKSLHKKNLDPKLRCSLCADLGAAAALAFWRQADFLTGVIARGQKTMLAVTTTLLVHSIIESP